MFFPRFAGDFAEETSGQDYSDGERMLLIDDEAAVRMVIVEVLTENGYCVVELADGPSG
jgi:PleD family two-component response regulator